MCVSYFLEKHRLSFTEMPCFRKTWRSGKHVLWNFARVTGSSYVSRTSWSGTMFWRAQRTGVPHGNLSSLDTGLASFQGRSRFPIHLRFGVRNQPEICGLGFGQCCTDSGDTLRGWMVMDLDASNRWLLRLLRLLRTRNSFVISVDMVWYDDMMWCDMMWYDMIWYHMIWYVWMLCVVRWELWGIGADWDFPRTIPSDRHPFWWWNSSVGALAKDSKSPFDPLPFLKAPWNKCIIHDETVRFCGSRFIFETVLRFHGSTVPIVLFLRFGSVQF